jgi:UDP-glucose 4-epimerase
VLSGRNTCGWRLFDRPGRTIAKRPIAEVFSTCYTNNCVNNTAEPQTNSAPSVLLTGGAGFLGRHLASALAASGAKVTVLDDLSCVNSTFACPELQHERIQCISGTVFDAMLVSDLVQDHRTVVHFASVVGVEETISRPFDTVENLEGTLNVVRALTPDHVVLFGSSADVYGAHSHYYQRPMRETDYFLFEDARVNRWVYPHVKALEESLIANSPARSVVIRVFNTYGPSMDYPAPKRVVPHFLDNILSNQPLKLSGEGAQTRCFCYVGDMIEGMQRALNFAAAQAPGANDCFNLGSPEPIAMKDLAAMMLGIAMRLGVLREPLPILANAFRYSQNFDDTWNRVPDISHARKALGFAPRTSLEAGLERTITYYQKLTAEKSLHAVREHTEAARLQSGAPRQVPDSV